MSKIDILLLRREMQNIALNIGNYTQEELKDLFDEHECLEKLLKEDKDAQD